MKTQSLLTTCVAALAISTAQANPRIADIEVHAQLVHEEVDIHIEKGEAKVSGVYKFKNDSRSFLNLQIYLPVYAEEGTPEEQMRPQFKMGDQQILKARFIKPEWEKVDSNIKSFGELPQIEGQRVHWYLVPYLPQQPNQKEFSLQITYSQKLSAKGEFIYTPLIPKQDEQNDYGSITITADAPIKLQNPDHHDFKEERQKLVVEPHDKKAIIVALAKVTPQIP